MTTGSNCSPFRVYSAEETGKDGYPFAWHKTVKHLVREQAGHRCVRCGHPYRCGEQGNGEWSRCDERCSHAEPIRIWDAARGSWVKHDLLPDGAGRAIRAQPGRVEAQWRILTVHHLRLGDEAKRDLRWFNLAALCQRCHLTIQGKVQMERIWPWPHSEWFRVYAAGWYAWSYLGEDLTRTEVEARMDELLALELVT